MAAPVTVEGFEARTAPIEARPALRARLGFYGFLDHRDPHRGDAHPAYISSKNQLPSQNSRG
jgi:hypothetical protein